MPRVDFYKIFGASAPARKITDDDIDTVNAALGDVDVGSSPSSTAARHTSDLADLIVETNPALGRTDALHYLINTAQGRTLLLRTLGKRQRKETFTVKTLDADQWHVVAKADPLWFVQAVEKGAQPAGDAYQLTMTAAKAAFPELSEARAFAKLVGEHQILQTFAFNKVDAFSYMQSEPLRKATYQSDFPEQMPTAPVYTGGETGPSRRVSSPPRRDAPAEIGEVGDKAYQQLMTMARKLHETGKYKTVEQAFAAIMAEGDNAQLAADAVLRTRARNMSAPRNV
jgi:hypothetical protein